LFHLESFPVTPLIIDIWADLACPWCYIGERRLTRALRSRPALRVIRRWRPFQLQPDLPPEGLPWEEFVETKFGGATRAEPMLRHVEGVGAAEGIPFHFNRMRRAPHTGDAHRLILLAAEEGREWEMVDSLFAAHFTHGANLSLRRDLVAAAAAAGIDRESVATLFQGDRLADEVAESLGAARELGIQGVPFFVFGERYAVSGAQPHELLLEAMEATLREASLYG